MRTISFIKRASLVGAALSLVALVAGPSVLAAITINEYPITTTPASQPHHLVLGPDGNMWFTEFEPSGKIGVMSPSGAMITEHTLAANAHPNDIIVGPDGNIWFTEYASPGGSAAIGRIIPGVSLTEFPVSPSTARPHALTMGPDGNMWFTELGSHTVSRIQTDGTILPAFPLTSLPCGGSCEPYGITVGPDGNIWFTEWTSNRIVKMSPSGTIIDSYPIAAPYDHPYEIVSGSDGKLWFTLQRESAAAGRAVASITTSGAISYHLTPTSGAAPHSIVAGPDGNLWFTEGSIHKVAMIAPSTGVITEYATPTTPSSPFGIAVGPNNTIWFAESNTAANRIGVVMGLTIPSSPSPGAGATGSPGAPSTGFGFYRDPLQTLIAFTLVATLLIGLSLAGHKIAKQHF